MKSGEQALFEAHIVKGAALMTVRAWTLALRPLFKVLKEIGQKADVISANLAEVNKLIS